MFVHEGIHNAVERLINPRVVGRAHKTYQIFGSKRVLIIVDQLKSDTPFLLKWRRLLALRVVSHHKSYVML